MWPLHTLENEIVTISCSPKNISFCWIHKDKRSSLLSVRAYERHELHHLELENLILFNPTTIKKHITNFVTRHKKQDAFIAMSLQGPSIIEKYVTHTTSSPQKTDFGIKHSSAIIGNYSYLYPNDQGQFVFYLYTAPRSLLLPYQLLAINAQLNLITLTTKRMALLAAYKNVFGTAFRRSQLGIDMMKHHNHIEKLIPPDTLRRKLIIPTHIAKDEYIHLTTAYGLFMLGDLP